MWHSVFGPMMCILSGGTHDGPNLSRMRPGTTVKLITSKTPISYSKSLSFFVQRLLSNVRKVRFHCHCHRQSLVHFSSNHSE